MSIETGYCTNVHAGPDLAQTQANLLEHALAVKRSFSPDKTMGIGLWLAAPAAAQLQDPAELEPFKAWLAEQQLHPFTLNGFPYGNFHQEVVKHDVYLPTWMDPARQIYTDNLVTVLDQLLPDGCQGSISTLPICWGTPRPSTAELDQAADHLLAIASRLARLESESGRLIYICLEPEPGCVLERGDDVVQFFQQHLLPRGNEHEVLRYLRVCHDVCHSAVMFEGQSDVLAMFQAAGIRVGKVQVSAAVEARLEQLEPDQRVLAMEQLAGFAEHRYLHQTSIRSADGTIRFYQDLAEALEQAGDASQLNETWCTHFHVPIYLTDFGQLHTSQPQILECLEFCREDSNLIHYEVETYAWTVLPESLQQPSLADGIAREMQWFAELAGC